MVAACLIASPGIGGAQAADPSPFLDPTFGEGGLALADFTTGEDGANAVDIGSDGSIVATGFGGLGDPSRPHVAGFAFAKYLSSGSPDLGFSGDGRALVDFGFVNQAATTADIDSADRVVATGTITTFDGSTSSIGIARLLPEGTPDPGFGDDGMVAIQPGTLSASYDAAIDADDGVVVLGAATGARGFRPTLIRFESDGSLDQSFGAGGILQFGKVGEDAYKAIAIDRRGRLLIAGAARPQGSKHAVPTLRRISPTGKLDPSYGRDGVGLPLGRMVGEGAAVVLDESGRPLVTATCGCGPSGDDDFAVGRLTVRGRPDATFSKDGRAYVRFGSRDARPASIAVDRANAQIVIAGSVRVDGDNDWALARLKPSGKPDRSFGDGFTISASLGGGVEGIREITVDSASRVVAAGLGVGPLGADFAVARFR